MIFNQIFINMGEINRKKLDLIPVNSPSNVLFLAINARSISWFGNGSASLTPAPVTGCNTSGWGSNTGVDSGSGGRCWWWLSTVPSGFRDELLLLRWICPGDNDRGVCSLLADWWNRWWGRAIGPLCESDGGGGGGVISGSCADPVMGCIIPGKWWRGNDIPPDEIPTANPEVEELIQTDIISRIHRHFLGTLSISSSNE